MVEKTMYMDTFNRYNRLQQELMFLEQKYAYLLNQREIEKEEDSEWFEELTKQLGKYGITTDREKIRQDGLMETISQLKEEDIIDVLNRFFWTENSEISEEKEENLNNILLSSFLSDINRYKSVKLELNNLLSNQEQAPIINRISKLIKEDIKTTLRTEKSILDFQEGKEMTYEGTKRFKRSRRRGVEKEGDATVENQVATDGLNNPDSYLAKDVGDAAVQKFRSRELHDKFTTSILTFHEIEKLYQKYNYVFTMRDIKDTHTILNALRKGEMVLMTGDTGSGKTELSLLIANIYLDEIYKDKKERDKKLPVLVTGNSDTDFSDLTVEKVITSKNAVSDQNDAIAKDSNEKSNAENVLGIILKEKEVRDEISKMVDSNDNYTEEEKEDMKKSLMEFDMFKYNIFTDFHYQGIIKAMNEGVPLVLDEINGIPPEILLGLNHYFTRRVGEEVSIGNGFSPVRIKKGFCIICTGNDKDENSRMARYQGRFGIDESLLNRMRRICKGYYNQTTEKEIFGNENRQLENDGVEEESQIDYMNENELYGVILMLCFYDKDKVKRTRKRKKIDEISESILLEKMLDTETVGFNLMKKSFKDKNLNIEDSKRQVFNELNSLAKFIRHIQLAYQGKGNLIGGKTKVTLNKSPFSMRQLVSIIKDWKMDTKSLWFHLYNKYIKDIPLDNNDRYTTYVIAQEVGFLPDDVAISEDPKAMQEITTMIEKNINAEYHDGAHTRDAHIEEFNVDDSLLEKNLIITKQDVYKEYFGKQFGNIDDSEFEEEIEREKEELKEFGKYEERKDSIEDTRSKINDILKQINGMVYQAESDFKKTGNYNSYLKDKCDLKTYYEIKNMATQDEEGNFGFVCRDENLEVAKGILGELLNEIYKGENADAELIANLVEELQNLG